jgi:small nuclear ribonucleoprotein (snRNP)-like protein
MSEETPDTNDFPVDETKKKEPEQTLFDLSLDEKPIQLRLKTGDIIEAVLVEFDGNERDAYMNLMSKRFTTLPEGGTKVLDWKDSQAILLAKTLFRVATDGKRSPFTREEIQKFPTKTQNKLFEMAQKICGLTLEEEKKIEGE